MPLSGHRGGWPLRSSRSLLAVTLLSGGFQLAVALSANLDLSACEHIVWRHIADGAVQPDLVMTKAGIEMDLFTPYQSVAINAPTRVFDFPMHRAAPRRHLLQHHRTAVTRGDVHESGQAVSLPTIMGSLVGWRAQEYHGHWLVWLVFFGNDHDSYACAPSLVCD